MHPRYWYLEHKHLALVDEQKKRDTEQKVPTQPRSPRVRGGSLQFQRQVTLTRPSRMANAIPVDMEGNQHQQINLLNQMQGKSQPAEQQEQPMEPPQINQTSLIILQGTKRTGIQVPQLSWLMITNWMKHQHLPHPVSGTHPEWKLWEGECSRSPDITRIGQKMDTLLVRETIENEAGTQRMLIMMKDIMRAGMMMMTAVHQV